MTLHSFWLNLEYTLAVLKVLARPLGRGLRDGPLWFLLVISLAALAFGCGASRVQIVSERPVPSSEPDIRIMGEGWERWRVNERQVENCIWFACRDIERSSRAVWREY